MIIRFSLLFLFSLSFSVEAGSGYLRRVVEYEGVPIALNIAPGYEFILHFPDRSSVQVPSTLSEKVEATQVDEKIVSFFVKKAFTPERVVVSSDHETYLLDLSGEPDADKSSYVVKIRAVKPPIESSAQGPEQGPEVGRAYSSEKLKNHPAITLTRYAAQTLWAPDRLMPDDAAIRRVPVPNSAQHMAEGLLRGERTLNRVSAAWSGYGWHVTAVEVVNRSPARISIDPRTVRGAFRFITPQHVSIEPSGSTEDRTTLYLISKQPFIEALK